MDPATGLPVAAPPVEAVDVGQIQIKLNPPLSDLTLAQVLEAIVRVAEKPLKISYLDYAVMISLKGAETTPLFMRECTVDQTRSCRGSKALWVFPLISKARVVAVVVVVVVAVVAVAVAVTDRAC